MSTFYQTIETVNIFENNLSPPSLGGGGGGPGFCHNTPLKMPCLYGENEQNEYIMIIFLFPKIV